LQRLPAFAPPAPENEIEPYEADPEASEGGSWLPLMGLAAFLLGVVALEGRAVVASSGDYERCFMAQGRLMHHILDPRTGRPTQGPHGVSLLARDVAAVNGLGAAAMVLGLSRGRALLQAQPGVESLIAARDGSVWQSAGMAARLLPAHV
ncbi:MAG: FAD:protein FMN transferase, partial [Aquabacterium sp.]|nr:FAD:protein FMN transferase [Aquabacterium sp.]